VDQRENRFRIGTVHKIIVENRKQLRSNITSVSSKKVKQNLTAVVVGWWTTSPSMSCLNTGATTIRKFPHYQKGLKKTKKLEEFSTINYLIL
jgi:hypothetical protein